MTDLMKMKRQLHREVLLHCRDLRKLLYSCLFFVMVLVFFPLTISAETATLRAIVPGFIWIDLLFAFYLSSEQLFQQDYDEGVIEQWLVSNYPLSMLIAAKVLVHWCLNLLPILLLCPLVGVLFHLDVHEITVLMLSILCGSPTLLFLCALASAFSTGLKQKGVLMALILFPLTIPVMIFGSSTMTAVLNGQEVAGYLGLLLAFSVMAVGLLPVTIGAVVRLCLSE